MTEFLLGAHLDNLDDPPDASYAKLRAMRADVVGTLWTNGTRHRRAVYDRLERELDLPIYIVRVGPSGKTTPRQWTRDAEDALREVPPQAFVEGRVRVRCLNEVNLPDEGDWGPEEYATFLSDCGALFRDDVPLVAAPISLGHPNWSDWWPRFVAACGGSIPADRIAVNCYAHLVGHARTFAAFGRPVDVTEINTLELPPGRERGRWTIARCREMAAAGIESAQVFIVGGKSFGAWDERYVVSDEEAEEIGQRGAITVADTKPTKKPQERPQEPTMENDWYPLAARKPIAVNYRPGRRGKVRAIVNHVADGYGSLFGWFSNPAAGVSSHFWIGRKGEVEQYRPLSDECWTNGVLSKPSLAVPLIRELATSGVNPNAVTVAIEHEGKPADGLTPAQLAASRSLHSWLAQVFGLGLNRQTVLGHYQFDSVTRAHCPGPKFPWTEVIGVPTPTKPDVTKLRDQAWQLAEAFEKAGYPWLGQTIKGAVALSKGDK